MQALTLSLPTTWVALCIGHEAISSRTGCQDFGEETKLGCPGIPTAVGGGGVKILPRVVSRGDLTSGRPHPVSRFELTQTHPKEMAHPGPRVGIRRPGFLQVLPPTRLATWHTFPRLLLSLRAPIYKTSSSVLQREPLRKEVLLYQQ